MWREKMMWVAWPAFLGACVLELLVFATVDPLSLHWLDHPLVGSRQAVYTLAFFVFWLILLGSGLLTVLLALPYAPPADPPAGD